MFSVVQKFGKTKTQETVQLYALFGIFDGHGGSGVAAHFAADHLAALYAQHALGDVEKALRMSFAAAHGQIINKTNSGTTAVVALIRDAQLYIAWAGDSRAVLERNGNVAYVTRDHKPNDPIEKAAIEKRGGHVITIHGCARVDGRLAIARSLGDRDVVDHISADPEIKSITLDPQSSFLILACDGIWDVLSNQQAVTLVRTKLKQYSTMSIAAEKRHLPHERVTEKGSTTNGGPLMAARALIDAAYNAGSTDNLSALVITFDWHMNVSEKQDLTSLWQSVWQRIKHFFGF
jgi:protein phosphatase 1L